MSQEVVAVRRARAAILTFEGPHLVAYNFLTGTTAALSTTGAEILASALDWRELADLRRTVAAVTGLEQATFELDGLLEASLLLRAGSEAAERDAQYENEWDWGLITGAYHFGSKNQKYMPPQDVPEFLSQRMSTTPARPLHRSNVRYQPVIDMPSPSADNELLDLMRRRRSHRGFDPDPDAEISLDQLRDCLFAGLGITGFARVPFESEELPLKMTPSGGGRNPYEGYVISRKVNDLPPGIYHYSGAENSLGRVSWEAIPKLHELLGGQTWMDDAAALVLLVADLRRTMRKYAFPTAYRVVLLEAGHIAQNILLAATHHELASVPTCALDDAGMEALVGTRDLTRCAVYAVALGQRAEASAVDLQEIRPNPRC